MWHIRLMMTKLKDVLGRPETWPEEIQAELAEIALDIEATLHGAVCRASPDELQAIDEADRSETASEAEVEAAFATFRRG